jgi:NTE family protein
MPFDQIRRRAMGIRRKDVAPFDPLLLVKGLFTRSLFPASALRTAIARIAPPARFESLKIPLTVTAVDVDSGELLLLGGRDRRGQDIDLADALYATCALPLYFPPLEVDGRRLADGGLRAVLPLGPALELEKDADLFVAVNVGPGFDERPPSPPSGDGNQAQPPEATAPARIPAVVRTHGEAMRVMMADQTERMLAEWPKNGPRLIYVRAVAETEATFAVDRVQAYVEMGYQATKKALG